MMRTSESGCGCGAEPVFAASLDDLVPIAVVIAAGCERCAENMVKRALRHGCEPESIERTLGVVAHLRGADCFAAAVGSDVLGRMAKPLDAGRRALREAAAGVGELE